MKLNDIILGDCLELMKDIPNGSIDMILCDLPYGTTACKWDVIIPFDKLWEQYHRIIKDNGAIILTASQPFTSALVMSNIKNFKYEWIWNKVKPSGHLNAKKQPMKEHENILVFCVGKCKYNPQGTIQLNKKQTKSNSNTTIGNGYSTFGKNNKTTIQTIGNYPRTILKYNKLGKPIHPTQKPVALFEYLIKTYTNEGDTVLDNCAGSGTTGIACLKTKRQFILMEQDPNYFEKIKKRVDFNKNFEPKTLFGNGW